jgi:hypothetical protein
MKTRKDSLRELERIANEMDNIGKDLRRYERVWAAELADREAKGLTGDAVIEHYNQWMLDAGMPECVVND